MVDKDIEAVAGAMPDVPQYRYATLVDYDPETNLSTISMRDGEIEDVPKLAHVSLLEKQERLLAWGNATSSTRLSIPVPPGCDGGARVEIVGRVDGSENSISLRVNNDSSSIYRIVRNTLNGTSTPSGSSSTSTDAWSVGRMSNVIGHMDVKLMPSADRTIHDSQTQMQSIGYATSSNTSQVATGRLNSSQTIETLDFIAPDNWLTDTTWRLYGTKIYESLPQLLCLKTKQIPLTIIGVLDGSTI